MSGAGVVQECAATREQAAAAPYTVATAIADAQYYRAHPECVVGTQQLKRVVDTLLSAVESSPAFYNAVCRGQEVFVLVEQDRAAPGAIFAWATAAEAHGCKKVEPARAKAVRWSQSPRVETKWPD